MAYLDKKYLDFSGLTLYDKKIKEYIPITHGYYSDGKFYSDSTLTTLITGEAKRLYIDLRNNGLYECINGVFVVLGGGSGTSDYGHLTNKPSINNVELVGNKTLANLGIQSALTFDETPTENSNNPVKSGGVYSGLSNKVDKVDGKGLSTNDYTTTEKNKLAGISSGAEVNVQSDWNQTDNSQDDYIKNRPTLGTAAAKDVPTTGNASSTQVVMGDDTRLSDSRNAKDVYNWAKASTKPSYTADEVGAIASTDKGIAGGVAELDNSGKVPSSQLPSYVDDVLEYSSTSAFPSTGEIGKIYVATDTNKTYRWSGTAYVELKGDLALGETSSTAYRGDRGKTAYDHATDANKLTTATASGLYKVASTANGHIASLTAVQKSDITALGIPSENTTYSNATTSTAGLMSASDKTKLNGIATGATANTGTVTKIATGVGLAGGDVTTTGKIKADLLSETKLTNASAAATETAGRVYPVALDKNGKLAVNVPWTDNNTDTKVAQTATTTSSNYEVLFSGTADNTTRTEGARKNSNLLFNPSTGNLQATQLNGVKIGSSPKFTDTTYSNATTSTAGLMSAADKTKLDGITSNSTNVQVSATQPTDQVAGDVWLVLK